jgi:pyruvate/2-oxoglutarate dehydrogenase complex dihydrolipoamide acyltransferase (E2) component
MATTDVIMPKTGMYLEDIALLEWHAGEGAEVAPGDVLFTLETDKITSDVEAEVAGFVHRLAEAGTLIPIGGVVGVIASSREEYDALVAAAPAGGDAFEPAQSELFLDYIRATDDPGTTGTVAPPAAEPPPSPTPPSRGRLVSPRARALIERLGLGAEVVDAIPATGPGGRVTDRDVQAFVDADGPAGRTEAPPGPTAPAPLVEVAVAERIPLKGRRRVIARRMLESLQTTAQLTSILEIEAGSLVDWRERAEPRPGYAAIFVAIVAAALRRHPLMNSRVEGDAIEVLADVNVAFAVNTDDGVIVPVVRHADTLSLAEIDARVADLTERVRNATITLAEVEGGTFTLSNSGRATVDITTAILNPPQAAILWLGRIRERPVAIERAVVVRPTVQACLTYDHRVIDGVPAAAFLGTVEELVRAVPDSLPLR